MVENQVALAEDISVENKTQNIIQKHCIHPDSFDAQFLANLIKAGYIINLSVCSTFINNYFCRFLR